MSRKITVKIVHGFVTPERGGTPVHGGNPAGVAILDTLDLTEAEMQRIAASVGYSETAFVSKSQTEAFRLDFFTPTRRIAHCGHATIAAFSYLASIGRVEEGATSKETVDGPRKIMIEGGAAYMEQLAPRYEASSEWAARGVDEDDVLQSLGLNSDQLHFAMRPTLVNTGNSFMIVGVSNSAVLSNLVPDMAAIEKISESLDLIGYYVFALDKRMADATTRMFAPHYGIAEESATGMAAGPLACVLRDFLGEDRTDFLVVQGEFMTPPSPSEIQVRLNLQDGAIAGLMVGGLGRVMKEITVDLV